MPRLMSVALTADAVLARRKTVTRRAGWTMLHPGDRITLCRKVMGRRKGQPLERFCTVTVVSVRRERLDAITDEDVFREGFTGYDMEDWPDTPAEWFVRFFTEQMGGSPDQIITRIEWRYDDA